MIVDLHVHTVYSDGLADIEDLLNIYEPGSIIALTDHNCLRAGIDKSFCRCEKFRIIPGVELGLPGQPEYLVYFPFTSEEIINEAEQILQALREADCYITKLAYHSLSLNNWENDLAMALPPKYKLKQARTMELARIITLYERITFLEALQIARTAKQKIYSMLKKSNCEYSVKNYINAAEDSMWPFNFANKYHGEIVLAHPLREYSRSNQIGHFPKEIFINNLDNIFSAFIRHGGRQIEWCYYNPDQLLRWGIKLSEEEFEGVWVDLVTKKKLAVTIGTDNHSAHKNDLPVTWLNRSYEFAKPVFPKWLQDYI